MEVSVSDVTVTFYYDDMTVEENYPADMWSLEPGTYVYLYELDTPFTSTPPWVQTLYELYEGTNYMNLPSVAYVIDPSFVNARPTSTAKSISRMTEAVCSMAGSLVKMPRSCRRKRKSTLEKNRLESTATRATKMASRLASSYFAAPTR